MENYRVLFLFDFFNSKEKDEEKNKNTHQLEQINFLPCYSHSYHRLKWMRKGERGKKKKKSQETTNLTQKQIKSIPILCISREMLCYKQQIEFYSSSSSYFPSPTPHTIRLNCIVAQSKKEENKQLSEKSRRAF